ncbi:MAG: hypothetical protein OSA93_08170 [Akkermansiaceae bacterium]|nr:hypothetical protein [Akkermansiaceae bacterium]
MSGMPNAKGIGFVELIIDQLTETGILSPSALYEQPFLAVHAGGPEALFPNPKILEGLFDQINSLSNLGS